MHTVTEISRDSETVFYIYFHINNSTKNKQPLESATAHKTFHFNSLPQQLTKSLKIRRFSWNQQKVASSTPLRVENISKRNDINSAKAKDMVV